MLKTPRTVWRDFPLKTMRPSCGSLDGKGAVTVPLWGLDVGGMVSVAGRPLGCSVQVTIAYYNTVNLCDANPIYTYNHTYIYITYILYIHIHIYIYIHI